MALEIERKFLIPDPSRLPELPPGEPYIQGYLSDDPEVRFRIMENKVVLAVKRTLATGERLEFEFPREDLEPQEIDELKAIALWPPLEKVRHKIPFQGLTWEIDVYGGRNTGLVTAEVEIPERDFPIPFPPWINPDYDITGRVEYANITLTRSPLK